ncbi:MAG: hypothetical protein WCR66_13620 [Bacteroidota bacterium]
MCANELERLESFVVVDYEQIDKKYGRADDQPANSPVNRRKQIGKLCLQCPAFAVLEGECWVRERMQALGSEQRAKYGSVSVGGPGNSNPGHQGGIDGWYDSGWRQTD